jgi:hypothetical protein
VPLLLLLLLLFFPRAPLLQLLPAMTSGLQMAHYGYIGEGEW